MTTFQKNTHRFAVVFQSAALVVWAWYFTNYPGALGLIGFTWSVAFLALSVNALRKDRKTGVEL
jgi:hypothetical protein